MISSKCFPKHALLLVVLMSCLGCNDGTLYNNFQTIKGEVWKRSNNLQFETPISDTINTYDVYVQVRHNNNFPYVSPLETSQHTTHITPKHSQIPPTK